jgi:transcriptional regulator with XRE-family HTH domain
MPDGSLEVRPLREWREQLRYTTRLLAKRADVSTATLHRAESGDKVWAASAHKIADALGIQVSQVAEFLAWHLDE